MGHGVERRSTFHCTGSAESRCGAGVPELPTLKLFLQVKNTPTPSSGSEPGAALKD